jgi:DNA-binding transcriptional ArsR family regulator
MSRWSVLWSALAVASVLLLAAPALASPGTLEGRVTLPIEVQGARDADAGHGSFLLTGADGTVTLSLERATGSLLLVQHRAYGYVNTQEPQAGLLWGATTDRIPIDLAGATLRLQQRLPDFQLYAAGGALHLAGTQDQGPLLVGGLAESKEVTESLQQPLTVQLITDADRYAATIPAGQFQARADSGTASADGPLHLFLTQARLSLERGGAVQDLPVLFHIEQRAGQLFNPATKTWFGPGTHTEYIQESLELDGAAALQAAFAGTPGTLYSAAPTIQVAGASTLPGLAGTVQVTGKDGPVTHTLDGQQLALDGTYALRLHELDGRSRTARLDGNGDLTTVSYGAVTAHYPWGATVAAVGLGALALAAAAWILAQGKALLGGAAGTLVAGYARVQGEEILEHPGRAEVYERVKAFPGVNFVQLGAQVTFGASTLTYHLRVLEKNGYVHSVRDGRYLRFFDKRSGHYSGERKTAVSALRNETSAAMARHIRAHPGVPQCDLAAAFHVTPSTVTWHMNRLGAAGLVEKQRDGAHSRYYIARGWADLPEAEQQRQAPVAATA